MPMNRQDIVDAVRNCLDDDEWNYKLENEEDRCLLRTGCRIEGKLKAVEEVVDFGETFFLVFALCPINADPENLVEIAKFLHRVNFTRAVGGFLLDPNDGEIRFKVLVDCDGLDALPREIVDRALHMPFSMFHRFGDGIAALAMGFSDAETEYRKAMGADGEPPPDDAGEND